MRIKHLAALSTLFASAAIAQAQTAGSVIVSAGWRYSMPRNSASTFKDYALNGVPVTPVTPVGIKADAVSALGLSGTYFIDDNWAGELSLNTPARYPINGSHFWQNNSKVASVKQWGPTLLLKYYFGDAAVKLRPFLGVGLSYVWFNDAHFEQKIDPKLTTINLSLKNEWAPALNGGAIYQFNEHWFTSLSVSYMRLRPSTSLYARDNDGNEIRAKTKFKLDPISTFLNVGYRF